MKPRFKPGLNELLAIHEREYGRIPTSIVKNITRDCHAMCPKKPFIHIYNFYEALESISRSPFWIAYGGVRTASTLSTYLMDLLLGSLTNRYIRGWEGDFRAPSCFFEMVNSSQSLDAGLLKIHRPDKSCNDLLLSGTAKAIVTTRDFPSAAVSWARMRANIHSPFYSKNTSEEDVINFVRAQIDEEKAKTQLPGCLFLKVRDINADPCKSVGRVCKHLGIKISQVSLEEVARLITKKHLARFQEEIAKNSSGHDSKSFFHYNHIDDSGFDSKRIREIVRKEFARELGEDGYIAAGSPMSNTQASEHI